MTGVERVFLDTNVLLTATDPRRAGHAAALRVFERWPTQGTALFVSGQVLREYLVVATRPAAQNGLGLTWREAIGNVRAFRERVQILSEDAHTHACLLELIAEFGVSGKQVHDANIMATLLTGGVSALLTLNREDFARFGARCTLVDWPGDPED